MRILRCFARAARVLDVLWALVKALASATATKLFVSFFQIATAMSDVYLLPFPKDFDSFLSWFSGLNFSLLRLGIRLECFGLASFFNRLLFVAVAPVALVLLLLIGGVAFAAGPSTTVKEFYAKWLRCVPPCLLIIFLSFPPASSLAFRAFSCECFDTDACYLRADYSLMCGTADETGVLASYTPEYDRVRILAWACVALYPIGMPCLFLLLLISCLLYTSPSPRDRG